MAEDKMQDNLQSLRNDFAKLREDVTNIADSLKTFGRKSTEEIAEQTQKSAQLKETIEKLKARLDNTAQHGKDYVNKFEEQVSDRPVVSLIAAFGIGFFLAKLFDWGNRR